MHSVDRLRQARVAQSGEGSRMEVVVDGMVYGPMSEARAYGLAITLQQQGYVPLVRHG